MGWNRALQKNIFFKLRKNVFSRMLGHLSPVGWNRTLQQLWQVVRVVWLWKADYRKPRKLHSGKKTIFQALKNVFSALLLWNSDKPGFAKKTIFQALKKCFFGTALVKLRQARLCKKNNFQALNSKQLFFRMPLVKSANSTSLPRFSSLQIAQMHTIHN